MREFDKASDNFEKLIVLKQKQYGENSKHLVENIMQLMTSSQASRDVDLSIKRAKRAYNIMHAVINEADTKLITSSGIMTEEESKKLVEEIKKYKESLTDVIFTYLNLHRLTDDFQMANKLAKEHVDAAKESHGVYSRHYTYSLLVQAQCMTKLKFADHTKSLETINKALEIQLEVCAKNGTNFMHDKFLPRIYEEKGVICNMLVEQDAKYKFKAFQAFNNALEIMKTS